MSKCPKRLEYLLHNLWPPSTRYLCNFNMQPWNQLRVHGKRYDMKGRGKVVIGNQSWRWGVLCRAPYLHEVEWTRNELTNMKQDQVSPTPQTIKESYPFLPYFPLSFSLFPSPSPLLCVSSEREREKSLLHLSHDVFLFFHHLHLLPSSLIPHSLLPPLSQFPLFSNVCVHT